MEVPHPGSSYNPAFDDHQVLTALIFVIKKIRIHFAQAHNIYVVILGRVVTDPLRPALPPHTQNNLR